MPTDDIETGAGVLRKLMLMRCAEECDIRCHRHDCEATQELLANLLEHDCSKHCCHAEDLANLRSPVKKLEPGGEEALAGLRALLTGGSEDDVLTMTRLRNAIDWMVTRVA